MSKKVPKGCLNKIPNVLVSGHGLLFSFWANYYNSKTCLIRACWGKIIPYNHHPFFERPTVDGDDESHAGRGSKDTTFV